MIREGYAKMVSTSQDGHDVLVGIAGPRDAFGHAAMADQPRNYLVTEHCALTPVTAAAWDRDKARAIAAEFPEVHKRIDAQLARNLEAGPRPAAHGQRGPGRASGWPARCSNSRNATASPTRWAC